MAAVSAALFRRSRTGKGAYLDISLMETVLGWQSWPLTMARRGTTSPSFGRPSDRCAACYQIYRTADDRFVSLGPIEDKFWAIFCTTIGHPDWIGRQFEPLPQTDLIAEVAGTLAKHPFTDCEALFADVDCCLETVAELAELPDVPTSRRVVR